MEKKHIQKIEETDEAVTITFGKGDMKSEKSEEKPEVKEEAPKVEEAPKEQQPEDKTFENEKANKAVKSKNFLELQRLKKNI